MFTNPSYSHAVTVAGPLVFVSGQVAMDEQGRLVGPGDVQAQTRQAMRNMLAVLKALGAGWSDVVKFGWFLTDVSQIQVVRDVRDEFLAGVANPASTLVEVKALFCPGYLIEVEAVVASPSR